MGAGKTLDMSDAVFAAGIVRVGSYLMPRELNVVVEEIMPAASSYSRGLLDVSTLRSSNDDPISDESHPEFQDALISATPDGTVRSYFIDVGNDDGMLFAFSGRPMRNDEIVRELATDYNINASPEQVEDWSRHESMSEEQTSHKDRATAVGLDVLKSALSDPNSVYRDEDVDVSKLGYWLRPGHVLHPPGDESLGEHAFVALSYDRCVEILGGSDDNPQVGRPEMLSSVRRMFGDTGWTLYYKKPKPAAESAAARAKKLVDLLLSSGRP